MRITDLLNIRGIQLHTAPADKAAAIDLLADLQEKAGNITDKAAYKKEIWAREELDSTAVENGVAVPHARCSAVKRAGLAAITAPGGVDYGAEDGQPSTLFFMIAAPEGGGEVHMEMLSHLMVMLMDEEFCQKLLDAERAEDFLALIDAQERVKFPEEAPAARRTFSPVRRSPPATASSSPPTRTWSWPGLTASPCSGFPCPTASTSPRSSLRRSSTVRPPSTTTRAAGPWRRIPAARAWAAASTST